MMNKQKGQKQHTVGHSRGHARTPSYGKNLHKLAKITGDEGGAQEQSHRPSNQSPPTSPSHAQHVKRNSSTVSLPRTGSKVSIKKNTSNVSLKRNVSSTHVNRARPTTPLRKNNSRASQLDKLRGKNKAHFTVDAEDEAEEEEDQDGEWTEESSSPNLTRSNSVSKGNRSLASSPPRQAAEQVPNGTRLPHSPPESPRADGTPEGGLQSNDYMEPSRTNPRRTAAQPNADAITSRLLSGQSSSRLTPEVSSVSVNGVPGTHTPPLQSNQDSGQTPYTPSLPSNGISRFLNAPPSAASAGTRVSPLTNHASIRLQTPPLAQRPTSTYSALSSRAASPAPEAADALRRARSIPNLSTTKQRTPTATKDSTSREAPESYTFQPPPRLGGGSNILAKLNLWRDHERVEPLHGPPPTLMHRAPMGMLGTEERRVRLWEGAEAELGYIKRFRNPIVESARRVVKGPSGGKEKKRARDRDSVRGLAIHAGGPGHGVGDGMAENASAGSRRTLDSETHSNRPSSRTGSRNVRFEVGGEEEQRDRGRETRLELEGADGIEELLRRMWTGVDADAAEI